MTVPSVGSDPPRVCFGEFELDEAHAPLPFDQARLLDPVWGDRYVADSVLKTAIGDLRTVLGDDLRQPRYIETVPRRGYRFIAATMPPLQTSQPSGDLSDAYSIEVETHGAPFVGRKAELDSVFTNSHSN